ncbi:response regulator transcription factor [Rubrobacter tropicus]|uniref:response regulator transcription factor n=1 Tax=Rubrobacter tropicus TaxID=2653851 RepID=UPI00140D0A22|nr:response regulator transcription factor [Rubrobacter tropicus]
MQTGSNARPARVVLVEDHDSFCEALAFLMGGDPIFEIVAQAGTLAEAGGLS